MSLERRIAEARVAAREARTNTAVRLIARSGYLASGLLRVLIGVLALLLALHVAGAHADASGAFEAVRSVTGGTVILWLVAGGDFALALWLIVQGMLFRHRRVLEQWRQRLVYWGRAVVYVVIGFTAARFALGASRSDSIEATRRATSELLRVPGGEVVLGLVGAIVLITGVSMVWIGARRQFVKTVHLPDDRGPRTTVLVLGVAGYVAQGASIAVVGVFALVGAVTLDPSRAGGLDAALTTFTASTWGRVFLLLVGVGWIVAGAYAVIRARIARLDEDRAESAGR